MTTIKWIITYHLVGYQTFPRPPATPNAAALPGRRPRPPGYMFPIFTVKSVNPQCRVLCGVDWSLLFFVTLILVFPNRELVIIGALQSVHEVEGRGKHRCFIIIIILVKEHSHSAAGPRRRRQFQSPHIHSQGRVWTFYCWISLWGKVWSPPGVSAWINLSKHSRSQLPNKSARVSLAGLLPRLKGKSCSIQNCHKYLFKVKSMWGDKMAEQWTVALQRRPGLKM